MGLRDRPDSSKIIIFDYDDTICPSTYVDRYQIDRVDQMAENFQNLFADVAKYAAHCLQEASKYGEVIIITNSDEGWVHYSCEKFVPCLLPIIEKYRIVSARTAYEKFYPGQTLCWKAAAFAHEVNEYFENQSTSDESDDVNTASGSFESDESFDSSFSRESCGQREIISFGDSMEERTAVRIVADQLAAVPKSVMFVPSPSPVQIIGQLQLLTQQMRYICTHHAPLDLEISPDQARSFAETYIRRARPDLRQAKGLSAMLTTHSQKERAPASKCYTPIAYIPHPLLKGWGYGNMHLATVSSNRWISYPGSCLQFIIHYYTIIVTIKSENLNSITHYPSQHSYWPRYLNRRRHLLSNPLRHRSNRLFDQ